MRAGRADHACNTLTPHRFLRVPLSRFEARERGGTAAERVTADAVAIVLYGSCLSL